MSEIRYCANGCTRKTSDEKSPVQLDPDNPSRICENCEHNLSKWVREIPERYALTPVFVAHGTAEKNPDSKSTKRAEAAAPMRLEIIDLLDGRLGRKWNGTETTADRRGVVGTLLAIAQEIQDTRELTIPLTHTVSELCKFLKLHLEWLAEQDWIPGAYKELKALHNTLGNAIGEYRPRPVGQCPTPADDEKDCAGPLFANKGGGVHCAKCSAHWDAGHLRQLGLTLSQQEPA